MAADNYLRDIHREVMGNQQVKDILAQHPELKEPALKIMEVTANEHIPDHLLEQEWLSARTNAKHDPFATPSWIKGLPAIGEYVANHYFSDWQEHPELMDLVLTTIGVVVRVVMDIRLRRLFGAIDKSPDRQRIIRLRAGLLVEERVAKPREKKGATKQESASSLIGTIQAIQMIRACEEIQEREWQERLARLGEINTHIRKVMNGTIVQDLYQKARRQGLGKTLERLLAQEAELDFSSIQTALEKAAKESPLDALCAIRPEHLELLPTLSEDEALTEYVKCALMHFRLLRMGWSFEIKVSKEGVWKGVGQYVYVARTQTILISPEGSRLASFEVDKQLTGMVSETF